MDQTASGALTVLLNQGIKVAGVFNMRIYGVDEALHNLAFDSGDDNPGYPCNSE